MNLERILSCPRNIRVFISSVALFSFCLWLQLVGFSKEGENVFSASFTPKPVDTELGAEWRKTFKKPEAPFPRKIWQSWKTSVADLDEDARRNVQSWKKLNPEYRFELLTDEAAVSYVRDRFADRPDIVEIFVALHDHILRADLLRYLIIAAEGGVYSDVDTVALKSVRDWIPPWYRNETRLVVGVEIDEPTSPVSVFWHYNYGFCQWSFMAKPHHPVFEKVIAKSIDKLKGLATRQNTTISGIQATFDDVLATTGPGIFTDAVLEDLGERFEPGFSWANVTGITEPKLVGDVLILPVTSFASGQGHSKSGQAHEETALVKHLFKGSWVGEHPVVEHEETSEEIVISPVDAEEDIPLDDVVEPLDDVVE